MTTLDKFGKVCLGLILAGLFLLVIAPYLPDGLEDKAVLPSQGDIDNPTYVHPKIVEVTAAYTGPLTDYDKQQINKHISGLFGNKVRVRVYYYQEVSP